jgi:hypothetical protein
MKVVHAFFDRVTGAAAHRGAWRRDLQIAHVLIPPDQSPPNYNYEERSIWNARNPGFCLRLQLELDQADGF